MSSTTRSTVGPVARGASARSPTVSCQAGCGAPKKCSTLPRAIVGEVLAALVGRDQARVAHRAQQRAGQRAGADAGLDHAGAGEDVGQRDDLAGVLGVDHRGPARHRQHEVGQQRPQREVGRRPPVEVTTTPSGPPISSSCSTDPLWVWNALPGARVMVCMPALRVGELDPVAGAERPAAVVGAGWCGRVTALEGTRSAARSVGSAGAVSAAERAADVLGARARRRRGPSASTTRYSAAGCASSATQQVLARAGRRAPASRARCGARRSPTGTQGRRSIGAAPRRPPRSTMPTGWSVAVDDAPGRRRRRPAAAAAPRPAAASARTGRARRAKAAARRLGQPFAQTGPSASAWVGPGPDERGDQRPPRAAEERRLAAAAEGDGDGTATTSTASAASAVQPATRVPALLPAGEPPRPRPAAAARRRAGGPGSRLKTADQEVGDRPAA